VLTFIDDVQTVELPLTVFTSLNLFEVVPTSIVLSIFGVKVVLNIVWPLVKLIWVSPLQLTILFVWIDVQALTVVADIPAIKLVKPFTVPPVNAELTISDIVAKTLVLLGDVAPYRCI